MFHKLVLGSFLLLAALGCSKPEGSGQSKPAIGLNLGLTGAMAYWNTATNDGVKAAITDYNLANPGKEVRLVMEDNRGEAPAAVAALHKLASDKDVSVVLSTHTFLSKPQQAVAEKLNMPLVGTIISSATFGTTGKTSFLDYIAHEEMAPKTAAYALSAGLRKAAVFVVDDDFGRDGARLFTKDYLAGGGKVVAANEFSSKETDLRVKLAKLLADKPDAIYSVGREGSLIAVVRQARELGFKGVFLGSQAFESPTVLKELKELAEGIVFAGVTLEDSSEVNAWRAAWLKRTGTEPDWINMYGYSIGQYLAPVVAAAKGDRLAAGKALVSLDAKTIRGRVKMEADRRILAPITVMVIKNGKGIPVTGFK